MIIEGIGKMNETEIEASKGVGTRQIELFCHNNNITLPEEFELLYGANYQIVYIDHPWSDVVCCFCCRWNGP